MLSNKKTNYASPRTGVPNNLAKHKPILQFAATCCLNVTDIAAKSQNWFYVLGRLTDDALAVCSQPTSAQITELNVLYCQVLIN